MIVKELKHVVGLELFCNHCGATLEAYPRDLRVWEKPNPWVYVCDCAVCGGRILVYPEDIPSEWEFFMKRM